MRTYRLIALGMCVLATSAAGEGCATTGRACGALAQGATCCAGLQCTCGRLPGFAFDLCACRNGSFGQKEGDFAVLEDKAGVVRGSPPPPSNADWLAAQLKSNPGMSAAREAKLADQAHLSEAVTPVATVTAGKPNSSTPPEDIKANELYRDLPEHEIHLQRMSELQQAGLVDFPCPKETLVVAVSSAMVQMITPSGQFETGIGHSWAADDACQVRCKTNLLEELIDCRAVQQLCVEMIGCDFVEFNSDETWGTLKRNADSSAATPAPHTFSSVDAVQSAQPQPSVSPAATVPMVHNGVLVGPIVPAAVPVGTSCWVASCTAYSKYSGRPNCSDTARTDCCNDFLAKNPTLCRSCMQNAKCIFSAADTGGNVVAPSSGAAAGQAASRASQAPQRNPGCLFGAAVQIHGGEGTVHPVGGLLRPIIVGGVQRYDCRLVFSRLNV
jgi:hypothetical protein